LCGPSAMYPSMNRHGFIRMLGTVLVLSCLVLFAANAAFGRTGFFRTSDRKPTVKSSQCTTSSTASSDEDRATGGTISNDDNQSDQPSPEPSESDQPSPEPSESPQPTESPEPTEPPAPDERQSPEPQPSPSSRPSSQATGDRAAQCAQGGGR